MEFFSKLCELVDVKRGFGLFRGLLTLLVWCQNFVTRDANFRILDFYQVLWGRYCFSYANRRFLCVFGVPKKRHIQRKRFGLRRNGTIRVRLKEMREMWFYLKEMRTVSHFTSSQIQKKNRIFWYHYFETQKFLCYVCVGQVNFSGTYCCLGF